MYHPGQRNTVLRRSYIIWNADLRAGIERTCGGILSASWEVCWNLELGVKLGKTIDSEKYLNHPALISAHTHPERERQSARKRQKLPKGR